MSKEFAKPEAANGSKTALVLIQGTGAVRAGIWARSAAINDNFALGTMLPQVAWAVQEKNYAVLVMNPNHGVDPKAKDKFTPMNEHCSYLWKSYVEPSGFKDVLIIAHSMGGKCLVEIQKKFAATFYHQVSRVALTDSMVISKKDIGAKEASFVDNNFLHYQASEYELGHAIPDEMRRSYPTCKHVSAGHSKHEYTTGTSWPMIQMQFDGHLDKF